VFSRVQGELDLFGSAEPPAHKWTSSSLLFRFQQQQNAATETWIPSCRARYTAIARDVSKTVYYLPVLFKSNELRYTVEAIAPCAVFIWQYNSLA